MKPGAMTSRQAGVLKKIVSVKRQKAEQDMLRLQQDVRRIEAEIAALRTRLSALDQTADEFDGASLARRHGHVEQMVARIDALQTGLAARRVELEAAREALKRVMHSQGRLEE